MDCSYPTQAAGNKPKEDHMSYQNKISKSSDALKPHSTHATFKWLDQNYQLEDGVCLPRCTIYEHYQDFCDRNFLQPVNAASFGKIVRQHFPSLTTRRLGTRGQSKYHYYGLGIKPSSEYYPPDYIEKVKQGNQKKTSETRKTTCHEKPSTILPVFPDVNTLQLSDSIPTDKLKTFMVMYRAHCQRILDSVVRANFTEVENFLLHFWQGMPPHLHPVLASEVVVDLVAYCDTLLYKVIGNVLITSPLQNLPESLAGEYRMFSDMLRQWMETALKGLPPSLQKAKYEVAEGFINGLRRQTSLTKLAQVAQSELRNNTNSLDQLKLDWEGVDFQSVYAQTLYSIQSMKIPVNYCNLIPQFLYQFSTLLNEETGLDQFLSFAERMVQDAVHVEKSTTEDCFCLEDACQAFLLTWKFFNTKILKEFTMENAPSFGFFILLHMLMDDYVTHLLKTKLEREDEKKYYNKIQQLMKKDTQLVASPFEGMNRSSHSNSDSNSSSPPPDEEMPDSFEPDIVSSITSRRSRHESGQVSSVESFSSPTPSLSSIFPSTLSTCTLRSNETDPSLNASNSNVGGKSMPFFHSSCAATNLLHATTDVASKSISDFTGLGNFPSLTVPDSDTGTQSSVQRRYHQPLVQPPGPNPTLQRQSEEHLSPPVDFERDATSHARLYSQTTQNLQQQQQQQQLLHQHQPHDQPSILPHQTQTLLPPVKQKLQQGSAFNIFSLSSSSSPTFITQSSQANLGTQILPSCSLPISTPTQSFSLPASSHAQQPFGQKQIPQQNVMHGMVSDLSNSPAVGRPIPVTRPLSNIPSFTALNVPFSHSNSPTSLSGSNNLSLFPTVQGMYPYTQFVGIPAPMNNPFTPAGLQMPGPPNPMPGYSYLTNVPHSIYNPQLSTTTFSR